MPKIITEKQLDFDDVLIKQQPSDLRSRSEVDLIAKYKFKYGKPEYQGTPIMASNMGSIGTFEMAEAFAANNMFTCIRKYYSLDKWKEFLEDKKDLSNFAVCCSLKEKYQETMHQVLEYRPDIEYICIDIANGGINVFQDLIKKIRAQYPEKVIIAGNVCTEELTKKLILAGADIVKIGIGPGSACTTRKQTGIGRPQLSAIIGCAEVAHKLGAHIIADGGCQEPGHIGTAFAGGADFVMLGGMLSGTTETHGAIINISGKRYKRYYGDSSGHKEVNSVGANGVSEGRKMLIEHKGPISVIIKDILGGVRSTCTYTNSPNISDLSDNAEFYLINSSHKLNTSIVNDSISIEEK